MTYSEDTKRKFRIEFVEHPSAKRIVLSWMRRDHPRARDDRLMCMRTEFSALLGERWQTEATVAQMLSVVRRNGAWAYCYHAAPRRKEIHYWFGSKADYFLIFETIMHELTHAVGYHSEKDACRIAGVGLFALEELRERFGAPLPEPPWKEIVHENNRGKGRRFHSGCGEAVLRPGLGAGRH